MGRPRLSLGGTEFAVIRNSAEYTLVSAQATWSGVQADIATENRNASPVVNTLGGAGPWGFDIVSGGDYWASVSQMLYQDGTGPDSVDINVRFLVDGTEKIVAGVLESRFSDVSSQIKLYSYSGLLTGLTAGQRVTAQYWIDNTGNNFLTANDERSFIALTRIGATP